MKKILTMALMGTFLGGAILAPTTANAVPIQPAIQQQSNVGQLLKGLVTVNVQNIDVDVDIEDVVDVEDVLNGLEIRILNNAINRNEVASRNQDFLNDLLRDADIIDENQVVVGVLGGTFVVMDLLP